VPFQPFEIGPIRFTHFRSPELGRAFAREAEASQGERGLPAILCRGAKLKERELPDIPFLLEHVPTGRTIGKIVLYDPITRGRSGPVRLVSVIPGVLIEGQRTAAWGQRIARLFKGLLSREIAADNGDTYRIVELRFPGFEPGDEPTHAWVIANDPGFLQEVTSQGLIVATGTRPDPETGDPTLVLRRITDA
jgi:hypothetical protein